MTTFEPGCYFDSHRGHYIFPEIIRLAENEGRELNAEMMGILDRYEDDSHEADYPMESVIDESESAIQWLNDHRGREGYVWEWNDGDFGFYAIEEDDEL
jgi:hypothetical protein